jgi:hypothetical protein
MGALRGGGRRGCQGEASAFFFEKKEPKNFHSFATGGFAAIEKKSFCFFFFRKRRILP